MAIEKNISSRIIHKHDVEANWLKATNFTPLLGELIIYDTDDNFSYPRFKVGDGTTNVNKLPFISAPSDWNQNDINAVDYIKNRTHWAEYAPVEIMPETELNLTETETYADLSDILTSTMHDAEYIVTIDGIAYKCHSWYLTGEFRLGSSRALHEDDYWFNEHPENVPFLIDWYEEFDPMGWGGDSLESTIYAGIAFAVPGPHTVKIERLDAQYYHQLADEFIPSTIARVGHTHLYFGKCSTSASTAAKTVSIPNFKLEQGAVIHVQFQSTNNAQNPTLNVNSTGAKPLCRSNRSDSPMGPGDWQSGEIKTLVYNGTYWICTNWYNRALHRAHGQGYAVCTTDTATAVKTVDFPYFDNQEGGIVAIQFQHDVQANAKLSINNTGISDIYYRDAPITDGVIKAGDTATFMYASFQYKLLCVDHITGTPNWNAQENEPGYIANRTHWVEGSVTTEKITTNEQDFTYAIHPDSVGTYALILAGETYIISMDGTEYTCVAQLDTASNVTLVGNGALGGYEIANDPNVPFLLEHYMVTSNQYETLMNIRLTHQDGKTHTYTLSHFQPTTYHQLDENFIPDTIARTSAVEELTTAIANKKDKDLVVTYRKGSHYYVTHDCSELYAAFLNGQTIYFQKDLELLNLLEINNDYATFYMYYVTQEGKPRQQIVAIANDTIIMELDDEYDYATAAQLANKADKQHTHTISDITNLQTELDARVPANRTINGKSLEADISLTADDIGADANGSAAAALTEAQSYTDTATNNLQQQIDNLIPVFIGTQEQYNAKESEIPVGALVIITDDEINLDDDDAVSAILGKGKLGYLILN